MPKKLAAKDKDPAREFAVSLRRLRTARGMSLRGLGSRAGLTGAYVSQIEAGDRQPTLAAMTQIAKALGTTALEMMGGTKCS